MDEGKFWDLRDLENKTRKRGERSRGECSVGVSFNFVSRVRKIELEGREAKSQ